MEDKYLELLAQNAELKFRLEEQQRKIRSAVASDVAADQLPEDVEFFNPSNKNVDQLAAEARANCEAFMNANPEFNPSRENLEILSNAMYKRKLAPTVKNFQIVFALLQKAGALTEPEVTEEKIAAMTADEFKERLRDKKFAEAVEKLNAR